MRHAPVILACAAAAVLLATGCARHTQLSELSSGGADVGVAVTTRGGEELRGELESITAREVVVVVHYVHGGGVEIEGFGDDLRVIVDGERVPGEVIDVERLDGARVARVRRVLPAQEIDSATFHRSEQESSLAAILSLLLGPSVGALLALAI
jgi:hypothetical protein